MTSMTSALAVDIASDKKMTNQLLAAAGLPVPRSEVVRSADEAVDGRRAHRLPRRDEAARRQPRARRGVEPVRQEGDPRRLRTRARPVPRREGRRGDLRSGERLSRAGGGRSDGGDRRARAGPRGRRRRAHDPGAGRDHEPGPASRDRPREGADEDHGRRQGRGVRARPGFALDDVPAEGERVLLRGDRQHVDGRHLDRPHLRGARGQRRDRRGGREGGRARRGGHRLPGARHHASPCARPAARSSR